MFRSSAAWLKPLSGLPVTEALSMGLAPISWSNCAACSRPKHAHLRAVWFHRMGAALRGRILIVDDDEQGMREFLTICLSRAGHQCIAATSGAEAIRLMSDRQFDLVITDLTMPGLGGMEVLRHACAPPVGADGDHGYSVRDHGYRDRSDENRRV